MGKLKLLLLLGASIVSFNVYALDGNSPSSAWNAASASQKHSYSQSVASLINSHAGRSMIHAQEVVSCIDTIFAPPLPDYIKMMTVGDAAAGCVQTLLGMK